MYAMVPEAAFILTSLLGLLVAVEFALALVPAVLVAVSEAHAMPMGRAIPPITVNHAILYRPVLPGQTKQMVLHVLRMHTAAQVMFAMAQVPVLIRSMRDHALLAAPVMLMV
jgi:hypothetical protein